MLPASGTRSPLSRLTSVVLPAPLDPTSETSSSDSTRKSTPSTARVSPKDFFSPCADSSGMSTIPPFAAGYPAEGADDALRHHQHQSHQDDPQQHLPVLRGLDDVGFQIVVGDTTQDGTDEALEPAQHGHEHDLAGEGPVQDVWRGQPVQRGEQCGRHAGKRAGDDKRVPAVPPDSDTDELGPDLIVADGLQRFSKRRGGDYPHHRHTDKEDEQYIVVVGKGEKPHLIARGADQPPE